jgi:hypothetical protein
VWTFGALPAAATTPATLRLDGLDDRVVVANAPELNPSGAITIEAWVRPLRLEGCQTIVDKASVVGYWLALCNGRIQFQPSGVLTERTGHLTVPLGEWSHVAVTFDGHTRRYYLDGALDLDEETPDSLPVNFFPVGIGGLGEPFLGATLPFQGNLAEVRLWSVARPAAEVRRDLVRQVRTPAPGLIAVWNLEGSADEAFGRFDGATLGGATFTGTAAPPTPHDPLPIPRVGGSGPCDSCGTLRLPIHDPHENRVFWMRRRRPSPTSACRCPAPLSDLPADPNRLWGSTSTSTAAATSSRSRRISGS